MRWLVTLGWTDGTQWQFFVDWSAARRAAAASQWAAHVESGLLRFGRVEDVAA